MSEFGTVRAGAVHFERVYAAPPEALWDAWTTPERVSRWLGATLTGAPEAGATVRLLWGDDPDSQVDLEVLVHEPPAALEWRWTIHGEPPTLLRVEFRPSGAGTLLVLDHSRLPANQVAGLSAGWHDFLDVLASGTPSDDDRWRELLPPYKEQVASLP